MTKFQAFTKKLDDFEDRHPVICDIIKVICGLFSVVCWGLIAYGFIYC